MKKIISLVILIVISITILPIVTLSVFNLTQEGVKEEIVTFELLDDGDLGYNVYDKINEYAIYDDYARATNFVSISVNDNIVDIASITFTSSIYIIDIYSLDGNPLKIYNDGTYIIDGFDVIIGDIISITFEVPQAPVISGVTATLLTLIPLLFVGLYVIYPFVSKKY